jgi:hypothetical protein
VLAVPLAVTLVVFGVIAWANRGSIDEQPNLVSMQESAQAMQRGGQAMLTHGQAMLDEGRRNGAPDLIAHGEHWIQDGQNLIQGGEWMAMNPTAPGSLVTDSAALSEQGTWGELTRTAQQMLHDPSDAKQVDLDALRWNGETMRAEGHNMAAHGQVMAEEVELMVERHGLQGQAADDLRSSARVMIDVGQNLEQNGQEMIDYADRLKKSLGN